MNPSKTFVRILFASLVLMISIGGHAVFAQSASDDLPQPTQADKRDDETNLDTQLYLLVATNQDIDDAKLPASLESVVRQLRASLPFKNYRLVATLINRVKNDGRLNLRWVGGPMMASAATSNSTPSFNEFRVNTVKLVQDAGGQHLVRMDGFGFGTRIPIQSGTALASNSQAPIINYESTGLNTDISMREGEAVIVGTLNVGPSGDAIILVMSAKRTNK
jgi:hypothetical protein